MNVLLTSLSLNIRLSKLSLFLTSCNLIDEILKPFKGSLSNLVYIEELTLAFGKNKFHQNGI